jgi:diguanylate cyclase (GGDEF)-like protein/PAS domain S-box-containing protein
MYAQRELRLHEEGEQVASQVTHDTEAVVIAAEALLREHPDALVCGLSANGLITPVPHSVGLWGQAAIEGRAVIDSVVADDRNVVAQLWVRVKHDGAAAGKVRMLSDPSKRVTLHFLDLRDAHGVLMCIVLPDGTPDADGLEAEPVAASAPRFATLLEDEGANVIECDETFTQMFGYTPDELLGRSVLDQIHPDDQGRAVEGWLAVVATRRAQQTRLRRRRKDGTWMWVDTTLHNFLNQPDRNYVLVELIDISAEMHAQEALEEREELLRRLTDAMPVGLLQLDTERNVVYNNARLLDILHGSPYEGSPSAPANGVSLLSEPHVSSSAASSILQTLTEEGLAVFDAALGEVLDEGIDRDVEADIVLPTGEWRRVLMSIRALLRQQRDVSGAITCVLDITDSARARQELEKRATFDPLTQCHNRSSILGALQLELEREDTSTAGVVYVDLDEFKPVNDKLGHAAGDELLVLVAERLKQASREHDLVGRLGGDEFLVLLRDIPGPVIAMSAAERICNAICSTFDLSTSTITLRASVGVACSQAGAITAEELVKRADAAMYQSKAAGQCVPVLAPAVP